VRAGVSLSVHQVIDHLLRLEGPERYSIFVDGSFEVPESWRSNSRVAIVRPPRILSKRRVPWELLFAGAASFACKTDVWLSTSSTGALYSRGAAWSSCTTSSRSRTRSTTPRERRA